MALNCAYELYNINTMKPHEYGLCDIERYILIKAKKASFNSSLYDQKC